MLFYLRHKRTIKFVGFFAIFFILIIIGVCYQKSHTKNVKSKVFPGTAMNSPVKKTLYYYSEKDAKKVNKEIDKILEEVEQDISVRLNQSPVSICNKEYILNSPYDLPKDLHSYIKESMQICEETNNAYSPCILPITQLWGIEDGYTEIPSEEEIEETLKLCNPMHLEVGENDITFHEDNMMIDFGAVGKGIAADKLLNYFEKSNLHGAVVSLGGNILVYGQKEKNSDWHIGIQDPRGKTGEYLGVVDLKNNKVISTSGDYEKYFEADGRRYHHIFDTKTGYPVQNELIAVTVISNRGFLADALSTACFALGIEKGLDYANQKECDAIFVTNDKKVYVTDGIKKNFRIVNENYKLEKFKTEKR